MIGHVYKTELCQFNAVLLYKRTTNINENLVPTTSVFRYK